MAVPIRFWLNDELVETDESPGRLVLDFVRAHGATGTKEGCKEGDCGACTILIGRRAPGGSVSYEPVTSCLVPLGEVHGQHVVTVEGINFPRELTPVQRAMVECGGTQCGYCTPGFIVSMTWYLMADEASPTLEGFQRAISGNLCRCTGYASINRACSRIVDDLESGPFSGVWGADDRLAALVDKGLLPGYFAQMGERLGALEEERPAAVPVESAEYFIAGGTDLYVQRGEAIPGAQVAILNRYPHMRGIRVERGAIVAGALTTFTEFAENPAVRALVPTIDDAMFLIASLHIRNRATLAGNIVNASPIGDVTQLLLALGGTVVLERGDSRREVAMEDFFLGYKTLDKHPHELVTAIRIPLGDDRTHTGFEKVSKRKALDIATVCSGARIVVDDGTIVSARISMGGVAPIPLLLRKTGEFLAGRELSSETVQGALRVAQTEVSPISDVRGSADYKRLLTHQLTIAHFTRLFPEQVRFEDLAS